MEKVDIIEFLRDGQLRTMPFGLSRQSLLDRLGDNPSWSVQISRRDKRPVLVKYDKIEFYFDSSVDQMLVGIQVTYSTPADKRRLQVDYADFNKQLDYEQVIKTLEMHDILFKKDISEWDSSGRTIVTQGGVTFYFFEDMTLEKFGRFIY